jgi:AraC family transcriptional regulator of adaptative response/methylated-DNA-[protein]-cysteine methyltransferase
MKESEALVNDRQTTKTSKSFWNDRISIHEELLNPGDSGVGTYADEVRYGFSNSPFGFFRVEVGPLGILALDFLDSLEHSNPATTQALMLRRWPKAVCVEDASLTERLAVDIFSRDSKAALPLYIRGNAFQLRIWRSILGIPESCLVSYALLAQMAEHAGAARAVGSALAANPIAYLIPCHRVLRADGHLGGFKWGLERKKTIIAYESALRDTDSKTIKAF